MLKRQACAKFQGQIFDESEVIQILKEVRWHFCQVYVCFRFSKVMDQIFLTVLGVVQGSFMATLGVASVLVHVV